MVLVLGTYRDTEVSRTHLLADVLAELRRERLFERVALRGSSNDEVVSFIQRQTGYDLDEGDQVRTTPPHTGSNASANNLPGL